jgi:hypothetical protein
MTPSHGMLPAFTCLKRGIQEFVTRHDPGGGRHDGGTVINPALE